MDKSKEIPEFNPWDYQEDEEEDIDPNDDEDEDFPGERRNPDPTDDNDRAYDAWVDNQLSKGEKA